MSKLPLLLAVAMTTLSTFATGCAPDGDEEDDLGETAAALSTSCSGWNDYKLEAHTIDGAQNPVASFHARTCLTKNAGTAKAYVDYKIYSAHDAVYSRFDVKVELQRRGSRIGFDSVVDSVVCHVASRANDAARTGKPETGACALGEINAHDGYYSADGRVDATWNETGFKDKSDYEKFQGSPLTKF